MHGDSRQRVLVLAAGLTPTVQSDDNNCRQIFRAKAFAGPMFPSAPVQDRFRAVKILSRKDGDMPSSRLSRLMRLPLITYDVMQRNVDGREPSRRREASALQRGISAMQVNGPGPVSGNTPIGRTESTDAAPKPEAPRAETPRDDVEISEISRMIEQTGQTANIRAERLAQIKADIDAGTYDTPEKMEAALSKLFGEIGLDESGDE